MNHVKPINDLDKASLIHDIEYLNPYLSQYGADNNMWKNMIKAGYVNIPLANFTRLALLIKDLVGYKVNKDLETYNLLRKEVELNEIAKDMDFSDLIDINQENTISEI